jgi:NADPH:quinone reductase-like Zn-dependent oxidoreductase
MKAIVTTGGDSTLRTDVPIPTANDGETLVKVHTVALNPTDWKHAKIVPTANIPLGCDFAGVVETTVGQSHLKIGDRVAGWVHGARSDAPQRGAFAEYVVTDTDMLFKFPDSIAFDDACTLPLAYCTAIQVFYDRLKLPEPTTPTQQPFPILIYGGTSSVGQYAIQLAKLSGLQVVTTASKKNHQHILDMGADKVVDYHDSNWVAQVKEFTQDKLEYALDCISEGETTTNVGKCMSSNGGRIVTLLPIQPNLPSNVTSEVTVVYTTFGREFTFGGTLHFAASASDHATAVKYTQLLPEFLEQGKIRPNRTKKCNGGLEGIKDGFKYMSEGNTSAEKLVYTL